MAVAIIMDFPGGSEKQYREVVDRMDLDGRMAPGGLCHAAGPTNSGWRVVDVWEDAGSFGRFRDEQIGPHAHAVGLGPPTARVIEVDAVQRGRGGEARFLQIVSIAGMDAAGFAEMDRQILPSGERPDDVVWHVNGPHEGGYVVIDTWTSREARDRFIEESVRPAMAAAGVSQPPEFEEMDVVATIAGAATTASA